MSEYTSLVLSHPVCDTLGFPGSSVVKNPPANAADMGSIPGLGRSPGERNGNPLQCSCLRNPMDMGLQRVGRDLATKQQLQYFVTAALENEYGRKKCSISVETAEAWQEGRYVI